MKRWALVVVGLYGLILVTLTAPVLMLAFVPYVRAAELKNVFAAWQYWLWIAVMLLGQAAMLKVPVSLASRRPVTRRALLPPILATGLMMGCMAAGAIYASFEFTFQGKEDWSWVGWGGVILAALTWCFWTVVFFRLSRNTNPADVVSRQCKLLLKGSILELLVAVPTHIVARHRDYCCAGVMTFIGITLGISVMLFSFGPAVFFLFVERWRRLHPCGAAPPAIH
jgi:hypothetical protein